MDCIFFYDRVEVIHDVSLYVKQVLKNFFFFFFSFGYILHFFTIFTTPALWSNLPSRSDNISHAVFTEMASCNDLKQKATNESVRIISMN